MKFTQSDATNQRIEKITMKHAVVGIDIAKETHAAQVTNFRGISLTSRHLSFSNSIEGFERFIRWVEELQQKKGLSSLIVGMEPTGHYWFNFANWLRNRGIQVVLVNPVTTHRNKENRDNSPSKNDPKDALVIADLISRGYYTEYQPQAEVFERLKSEMSHREYWVNQSVSLQNRIVRWIDLYFPEYATVFPDWTTKRSLITLRIFPLPHDLHGLSVDGIIVQWREHGMQRAGGISGKAKAAALLAAASRSIGCMSALEEAKRDLKRLIDEYERIMQILGELEKDIQVLLGENPLTAQLQSIHGLGPILTAAILGFAGDLRLYAHGRQLLRRAGLNLAECKSGRFTGQIKLSKRGDGTLRKYLYLATITLIGKNADFSKWHDRNVNQKGMKKHASVFKLLGKLARILIGMVHRQESYIPEQPVAA